MKNYFFTIILLALFLPIFLNTSCEKLPKPKAIVTVTDDKGIPVEGAEVMITTREGTVVYFNSGAKFSETSITNSAGQVSFEFKYEAIYDVKVVKSKDGVVSFDRFGKGVVILKDGNTFEEKIKIRQ